MFKVGDRVVHNSYGLCRIKATEIIDDTDYGEQEYYIIYIEKTKIMIPIAYANALRYPMKKECPFWKRRAARRPGLKQKPRLRTV